MSMAIFLLMWSMYTSLEDGLVGVKLGFLDGDATYNSSRQRMGDPMASQRARRRQICEKDFSPPERVLAPRPVSLDLVMSGST